MNLFWACFWFFASGFVFGALCEQLRVQRALKIHEAEGGNHGPE